MIARHDDRPGGSSMATQVVIGAHEALDALSRTHRDTLRAEARREAAMREVVAARTALQDARSALRLAVRDARDAGATFPQIAARLGVSVQRAQALFSKDPQAARR
jgi:hypothetical protein